MEQYNPSLGGDVKTAGAVVQVTGDSEGGSREGGRGDGERGMKCREVKFTGLIIAQMCAVREEKSSIPFRDILNEMTVTGQDKCIKN